MSNITKIANKFIKKLADPIEKEYERLDKDPDELSWEDVDPEYFGEGEEPSQEAPAQSWESLQWMMTQMLPKFLELSSEEQDRVIAELNKRKKPLKLAEKSKSKFQR